MAAAACLAPQAQADPLPAHAAAQPAAVTDAASYAGSSMTDLLSLKRAAASTRVRAQPAQPVSYTVRPGDSLSAIAGRFYHKQSAWPVLYWANHNKIRWANIVSTGQVLRIPAQPAKIPSAPGQLGPVAPAPAPAPVAATTGSTGSTGSSPAYAPAQAAPAAASNYSGGTAGGSFGQCVIARESGGNAQVMNSSGHYGLYQFSEGTWVAYGGSAGDFGHASAGEQNQVFSNAMAQGGQSNWAPYDGC